MTKKENEENNDHWWWITLLLILLTWAASAFWNKSCSQDVHDTIPCETHAIMKYIEKKTPKSVRYYVVYKSPQQNIEEIISIGKTTKEYAEECQANGIKPNLGIHLKNGQIISIIKYKRYVYSNSKEKKR